MNASLMLVCLLVVLGCQSLLAQEPSTKSDREKVGLIGPIAKIKVESTYFKFQNYKFVESERKLREESEYDKLGKLINQKKIPMYGDFAPCHYEYKYDDKYRETQRFCMEGTRERILEKYAYEDDRFGNWIKRRASVFDADGFRVQWTLYRTITYFDKRNIKIVGPERRWFNSQLRVVLSTVFYSRRAVNSTVRWPSYL